MSDHREVSRDAQAGQADPWSREEIDAAIAGLTRAGRSFSQRLGGIPFAERTDTTPRLGEQVATEAELARDSAPAEEGPAAESYEHRPASRADVEGRRRPGAEADQWPPDRSAPSAEDALEERMRVAEHEAREYLERAKQRADSLVNTMVGAVEREAADIRREAEEGIRERWRLAEAEAGRYVSDARQVADGMVSERQDVISSLSDGICVRAEALTGGMDDAAEIRSQFEVFVRALSRTADQIASGTRARDHPRPTRSEAGRSPGGRSALAA